MTWTAREQQYVKENYRKIKPALIAKHLSRGKSSVYNCAKRLKAKGELE
jgi:hypothetical protein